jgi:hypothetical protein
MVEYHLVTSKRGSAMLSTIYKPATSSFLLLLVYALIAPTSLIALRPAHAAPEAQVTINPDSAFNTVLPTARQQENQSRQGEAATAGPGAGEIDVSALVREAQRNGAVMHKQFLDYTYTLKKTRRTLDERGKTDEQQVQEFEAYPVRGEHVLIQLNTNGIPLPPWRVADDRRRAGAHLMQAEREASNRTEDKAKDTDAFDGYAAAGIYGRTRQGKHTTVSIDPTAFLRNGEFSAPRIERLNYRETIVLNFHIRPGTSLPPTRAFIAKLIGQIWIDVEDKVIVRLEAWPAPEFARKESAPSRPIQQARVVYQQSKLPTGVWFPSMIRMNSNGDESIFDGLNCDVAFEFSDYKRFNATSEDVKLNDTKKHP